MNTVKTRLEGIIRKTRNTNSEDEWTLVSRKKNKKKTRMQGLLDSTS